MDVILLERIERLGQMGDVVTVKPGFARNYLLPRKKALRATEANRAVFDQQRAQLEAENLKHREEAERVAKGMAGLTVVIVRQASDSDQLYGSVTPRDIAAGITDAGVTADRRQIKLDRPIKTVGMHSVRVDLHPEVSVEVIVNVARTEEEADIQARGERINRDGEIINIEEDAIEVETVFEEGAAPEAEELAVAEDATPEAETPAEEAGAEDAAPSEEDFEKTEGSDTLTNCPGQRLRQPPDRRVRSERHATTRWRGLVFSFMPCLSCLAWHLDCEPCQNIRPKIIRH